jgi:hypothetical protein
MEDVKQVMMGLLVTSLQTASNLLRLGHEPFWCFAFVLRADGSVACFAASEEELPAVVAAQAQPVTTECLAANRDEDAEDDNGHEAMQARLQELAAAGEVVATAVVSNELDDFRSPQAELTIEVELEHRDGWALLFAQSYRREGGDIHLGEVGQFEHDPVVFA